MPDRFKPARVPLRLGLLCALLLSAPLWAQEGQYSTRNPNRSNPTLILEAEMSNIRASSAQLGARIQTAMEKLEEVARLTSEQEKEAQVDSLFFTLRDEVYGVLNKLDLNSDFADALNRAKEGTIVLKSWYERQPPDYPNREQSIAQLERAIQEYDIVEERLNQSRALAQEKLSTIMRQHRVILQEMKIGKVLEAIAAARSVVEGLNDITRAMAVVEQKTQQSLQASIPIAN
ncbi:hypothetical protein [Thermochromatium tepidum]|jgi:hypothetical protein|uniref:Uncharacterized protein n=1 Tax=Thermochromatium tepidum ATCC 43061 TaxID=316276 RepID=A0A6I6E3M6_THETI|nr:hypothetical protein [Thermochromatium tepidum]QGU32362.1 hypothetical protein E6P07_04770 [Thermochromatium tepidum ATCC 43061]